METEIQKPSSEELINQAREFDAGKSNLKSEPKVGGKKRGPYKPREKSAKDTRPEKPPIEEQKQDAPKFNIPTEALCYPVVKAMSGMAVAYTKEPRAAMTPDEAEGIAKAMGMVLDKYLPDVASKYGPELVLGVSLGQYGLRLYAIKQVQAQAMRSHEQAQTANQGPRPNSAPAANLTVISEETPVL